MRILGMHPSYINHMNNINKVKPIKPEIIRDYEVAGTQCEKLLFVIKYLDSLENEEIIKLSYSLPKEGFRERDIVNFFYCEALKNEELRLKKNGSN